MFLISGTEKVPQRTYATKILPNFRVNFLMRFALKRLFYWVVPSNCSENSLALFVRSFGFGVRFWALMIFRPVNIFVRMVGEKLKYHPFWGSPLFYQAPPRQFQPPKCKSTPSKLQIVEGRFLCISIQNCRLEVANLRFGGCQLHFGGCQFTFRRPKLSWECFIEKG